MLNYEKLSDELQQRINDELLNGQGFIDKAIRRNPNHDKASLWRGAFVRDTEKIMHSSYYNRYADKTQVFSFYKNDDISHRALHVQLVSRIARNIGKMLGLDLDLIEAIALGHDIGHTPFGHAGEKFLNELYHANTGRYFNHNVQSVRVLDKIFSLNISLQTLDGILCHNGEFECKEYYCSKLDGFKEFDKKVEECYIDKSAINRLVPSTLEGCAVRISDMIAYIGKDRQDAIRTKLIDSEDIFEESEIGKYNATIINNLIVNIVENSYGKDYLKLDDAHYNALKNSKKDNYEIIYQNHKIADVYDKKIRPMFEELYTRLLSDLKSGVKSSPIFRHHIDFVNNANRFKDYDYAENSNCDEIVVDYIASMTDDYFIDLYEYIFNKKAPIEYISYFDNNKKSLF
ncbi:MAG: HD domain-containing protein, partial [Oscillospiraceae bacterium]|nr:HD domain-containing protein [Oscillospiraceae bacterium]